MEIKEDKDVYFFRVVGRVEVTNTNKKEHNKKEWRSGEIKIHKNFLFMKNNRYVSFKIPFKSKNIFNIPRNSNISLIFSWKPENLDSPDSRVIIRITSKDDLDKDLKSVLWMG
ncbi:hypothetical protein SAMN06265340_10348 [Desulfurobacterium atlanticum]|uniref:Uncharacterized protein n=1 Tax=Desulfurobacterium atlanticum TaxID=240169 RepID=A0A238YF09_9BACT|nr:hypothetical protein SAMN06265340_10348 [Desulfurobacterium atlanticum]